MKTKKRLNKFWNRNPFFYKVRHLLLFRTINIEALSKINYNIYNPIDSIPEIYFEINRRIFKECTQDLNDFDKALKIAIWLRNHIKGGKGLGIDSENALILMLKGGYGVCSDFCQVFNNFCVINDIKVREWGLKNKDAHTGGHSFNEIYDKALNKWVAIDVSKSIYFVNTLTIPLSAIEIFQESYKKHIQTIKFNENYIPAKDVINTFYCSDYYIPFVIDEYVNRYYDRFLKKYNSLPIPIIHGFLIMLNKSYVYKKVNRN